MAVVLLVGVFYAPDEFNEVVVMKKFHFWLPVIEFVLVAALLFITAFNPSPAGWESVMSLVAGNWAVAFWLLFVIVGWCFRRFWNAGCCGWPSTSSRPRARAR